VSMTVASAGEQDVSGGTTSATSVVSGGTQYVYSGTASGTVISNGGYQDAYGATSLTTVSSGGVEIVESGATANRTTVLSGGEIVEYYGATVTSLTSNTGAIVVVLSSGGIFPAAAVFEGATASPKGTSSLTAPVSSSAAAPAAEVTLAHLIHAMASFDEGPDSQGALFESVSGGAFQVESGTLAPDHHPLTHH
jgi:autotransporter passenger strand-loop-strand repeat protein